MRPEPRLTGLIVSSLLTFAASTAHAQLSYKLAPIGGRSELLGGTGMTYGRDATAAFLNPATAVLVDDQRLSFSVNFYKLTLTRSSSWYAPGPVDRARFGNVDPKSASLTDLDFDTLPSSLCLYFTSAKLHILDSVKDNPLLRDAHIGLCFATVADEEFNFGAENFSALRNGGSTRQIQTISQKFTKFDAGPTYAVRINNALSIGASLHGSLINHKSLLEASTVSFGTPVTPITSSYYGASKGSAFDLEATVGATLRFGKQTIGVSLRSPSLHIFGVGGVNRNTAYDGGAGSATDTLTASGSFVAHQPLRIGLGTGFEGAWGQFEINAFYFHQLEDSYRVQLHGTQTTTVNGGALVDQTTALNLSQRSKGVVDLGAGAEIFMSNRIGLLMGVSTDVSAAPEGTLRGTLFNYFEDRSNRIASSLGIGTHGTLGELNAGAQFSYGWGDRLSVDSYQLPATVGTASDHQYQLMFIIAGSTSLRNLKRAVEEVKKVVDEPTPQKPVSNPKSTKPASNPEPQKPLGNPLD